MSQPAEGPDLEHDPRTPEILDILAKETQLDRGALTLDARIEELGIPSLDMVQTIFAIETKYDVEIAVVADQTGSEFRTVRDLIAHALRSIDAAHAAAAGQSGTQTGGGMQTG